MPKLSSLQKGQSDPQLKEHGVWHDIIVPDVVDALRLKMRSLASNAARTWDLKKYREQRNHYLNDNVPPIEIIDQNDCDKLADVLVLEWNVTEEDDTPTPCTPDTVRVVMAQLPDARRSAIEAAGRNERYRRAEVKAIEGNSERPSTPASGTGAAA